MYDPTGDEKLQFLRDQGAQTQGLVGEAAEAAIKAQEAATAAQVGSTIIRGGLGKVLEGMDEVLGEVKKVSEGVGDVLDRVAGLEAAASESSAPTPLVPISSVASGTLEQPTVIDKQLTESDLPEKPARRIIMAHRREPLGRKRAARALAVTSLAAVVTTGVLAYSSLRGTTNHGGETKTALVEPPTHAVHATEKQAETSEGASRHHDKTTRRIHIKSDNKAKSHDGESSGESENAAGEPKATPQATKPQPTPPHRTSVARINPSVSTPPRQGTSGSNPAKSHADTAPKRSTNRAVNTGGAAYVKPTTSTRVSESEAARAAGGASPTTLAEAGGGAAAPLPDK
jgi:hypothetical protein